MSTPNTHGLEIINDAKSFPTEAGRYEVVFGETGSAPDRLGTVDSFEAACKDAAALLGVRADWVRIVDHKRGCVIARGK